MLIGIPTFHEILRKEIFEINHSLEELTEKPKLFEYSLIEKNGTTYKAMKRIPELQIIPTTYHFALKLEKEIKNG